jgi:hypothetical protein
LITKEFTIIADIEKPFKNRNFTVNTNDLNTLKIIATVKKSGEPLPLYSVTPRIAVRKPDKTVVFQDGVIANAIRGVCEFDLNNQAFMLMGNHKAEIMLYASGERVAVTESFTYTATGGILSGIAEESKTILEPVTQSLATIQATVDDLRENGTGIDAQARTDIDSLSAEMAQIAIQAPLPNGVDDTESIQSFIDNIPDGSTALFPNGTYLINAVTSIRPKSNIKLMFSKGTQFQALTNSVTNYAIIKISNRENIDIYNPYLIGERDTHNGTTGEWGYGLEIRGSKNINIYDPIIKNCWGDGIYLGSPIDPLTQPNNDNINIVRPYCENNRRQGISVISTDMTNIVDPYIVNTNGTAPEAGIDIEPNAGDIIKTVNIYNLRTKGNKGAGLLIYPRLGDLATKSQINVVGLTSKEDYRGLQIGASRDRTELLAINISGFQSYDAVSDGIKLDDIGFGTSINIIGQIKSNNTNGVTLSRTPSKDPTTITGIPAIDLDLQLIGTGKSLVNTTNIPEALNMMKGIKASFRDRNSGRFVDVGNQCPIEIVSEQIRYNTVTASALTLSPVHTMQGTRIVTNTGTTQNNTYTINESGYVAGSVIEFYSDSNFQMNIVTSDSAKIIMPFNGYRIQTTQKGAMIRIRKLDSGNWITEKVTGSWASY